MGHFECAENARSNAKLKYVDHVHKTYFLGIYVYNDKSLGKSSTALPWQQIVCNIFVLLMTLLHIIQLRCKLDNFKTVFAKPIDIVPT